MTPSLRRKVRERAANRCEYCQLPQNLTVLPHQIDHIRPEKHHGRSSAENLCLACACCNAAKGPNAAGYDPQTGKLTPLFDPRSDLWSDNFAWKGPLLRGKTAVGRATIDVLSINAHERVELRRLLIAVGVFTE